jgi:agmatinase
VSGLRFQVPEPLERAYAARRCEMTTPTSPPGLLRPVSTRFTLALERASGAAAAFFGAPLDVTGSFRPGSGAGPGAVRRLSDSLETYSPALDRDLEDLVLVDLGDLELYGLGVDDALEAVAGAMADAAGAARLAVMLGGEHTVSLGGFRGIRRIHPEAVLVQLDAHADLRESYDGEPLTHATWAYHAGVEFGFDSLVQLGLRSGAREEWSRTRRTAWSSHGLELTEALRALLSDRPLYLTVDIDVLDPSAAPGTGCPEPGGASYAELERFVHGLAGLRVVAVDVVEVAPTLDPSEITAAAAAKIVRDAVLLFGAGE